MPGLNPGDSLGPYQIIGPLGQGGMGQVYRARDTRLGREVAVKVSAEKFSERFEREAKVIASLNHANICTLFDVGSSPAAPSYLVMELIDGQTLAERIGEGPVGVDEALGIAKQIAAALGEAHERGVIHRDLKPANVKLTPSGSVKVLDFGLAKIGQPENSAMTSGSASGSAGESPTMTMNATQAGMILGTAAYMSPEQARGKSVDKRTDIWAFGVVLYEMLTGQHPFKGEGITDTLAAVIMKDPDFEPVPVRFRRAVQYCLQKDPHKRLRDISSVTVLLDEGTLSESMVTTRPVPAVPPPLPDASPRDRRQRDPNRWKWPVIGAVSIVALWFIFGQGGNRQETALPTLVARLTMDVAPAEMLSTSFYDRPGRTAFAISPNGRTIVFAGHKEGVVMLYKRPLADEQAVAIAGTEGAEYPFFSPNGAWVGFAANGKLKKVSLNGGPPVEICDIGGRLSGASWGADGQIAFRGPEGLMWLPKEDAKPELLVARDPAASVVSQSSPLVLPGGDTVLFTENSGPGWDESRIVAIDASSKARETVIDNAADPRYLPGYLVFVRGTDLLAVSFDRNQEEIRGAPVPLVTGVMRAMNAPNGNEETGMAQYAVSNNGTLVYAPGGGYPIPDTELVRMTRSGQETKVAAIKGALFDLRVSPDGTRMVGMNTLNGSREGTMLLFDLATGTSVRLTATWERGGGQALWRDNATVIFPGPNGAMTVGLNSGDQPEALPGGEGKGVPMSLSRDGHWFAAYEDGAIRVRALDAAADKKQVGPAGALDAEFSPDGKWIAYRSNESGRPEIYIEPFPGPGPKRRVSLNGGTNPAWSREGRELYFFEPGNRPDLNAVTIAADGSPGPPRALFSGPFSVTTPTRSYDVTPRGDFVLTRPIGGEPIDQRVTKLKVVLGWSEEVRSRLRER